MFSCDAAQRRTMLYQEGLLPADEMELMRRHHAQCPECAERTAPVLNLRRNLKGVAAPAIPATVSMRLRVKASRAAADRRRRRTIGELMKYWREEFKLWTDNLMRPLAIPTAGGFASALMLFSVFATGIGMPMCPAPHIDVPTGLYTEASVKTYLPLGFQNGDLVVELTIDDQGRVVDYSLPALTTPVPAELRRNIANHLLFTQFNPATSFGQPVSGKVRIWFRSSHIDVKG
jgi:hypothetical protein